MEESYVSSNVVANVVSSRRSSRDGCKGCKLPEVCLAYNKEAKQVLGAFVLERCFRVGCAQELTFLAAGFAMLREPVDLVSSMCKYMSTVFALQPQAERAIREAPALGGAPLGHHFVAFADSTWRVFTCSPRSCEDLTRLDSDEVYIRTPLARARTLGVHPEEVSELPDRIAELEAAAEELEDIADEGTRGASDGGVTPVAGTGHQACTPMVSGMPLASVQGGTVAVKFTPEAVLNCLQLSALLRPGASVQDALAAAAPIIHPSGGWPFHNSCAPVHIHSRASTSCEWLACGWTL